MDAPTLRRRAACAVLDPVLGEDDLLTALWLQHDTMRGEAVSDIIRYIDAVAERFVLDATTRKRLYDGLYRALRLSDKDLPIDPWPAMLAVRPAAAAGRGAAPAPVSDPWPAAPRFAAEPAPYPQPYAAPYQTPVQAAYPPAYPSVYPPAAQPAYPPPFQEPYPAPAAVAAPAPAAPVPLPVQAPPAMAPLPQVAELAPPAAMPPVAALPPVAPPAPAADPSAWTPDSGVPPEQAVFAELIATIAADIVQTQSADFGEWRASWLSLLERQSSATPQRMQLIAACRDLSPDQSQAELLQRWRMPLPAAQLAQQAHQLYVALCEGLGPVGADQVLTRAVRKVEQSPAARLYSPRKLM